MPDTNHYIELNLNINDNNETIKIPVYNSFTDTANSIIKINPKLVKITKTKYDDQGVTSHIYIEDEGWTGEKHAITGRFIIIALTDDIEKRNDISTKKLYIKVPDKVSHTNMMRNFMFFNLNYKVFAVPDNNYPIIIKGREECKFGKNCKFNKNGKCSFTHSN
jgi:hypothetical protein